MISNLKIIIVEDEYPIAMDTELKLSSIGFNVLGITDTFAGLMELIAEDTPDVILMDINLGDSGENGITIATKLKKIVAVPIVFLSAYSNPEIVSSALQTEPFGYLVKPYKIEDLVIAIQLARTNWMNQFSVSEIQENSADQETVFVQSGSKLIRVAIAEILFLQALDNYAIIQTQTNKYIVSSYLSSLAKKMSNKNFLQVHRSYIANLNNISSIDGNTIHIGKFEIPVSRSHRNELINRLNLV